MAAITENYVSFEIAKLLKEKGFNEETEYVFSNNGELLRLSHFGIKDLTNACNDYHTWKLPIEGVASIISAPTLQMAMKWLREKHNIVVELFIREDAKYVWYIHRIETMFNKKYLVFCWGSKNTKYERYEEACEAAIGYCLKHLIK